MSRLAIKIFVAGLVAWWFHQYVAVPWFFPVAPDNASGFAKDVNIAYCNAGIDVKIDLERTATQLRYKITHSFCPKKVPALDQPDAQKPVGSDAPMAEFLDQDGVFYDLEPLFGVAHPRIIDSSDVLLRRTEAVWRGKPGQEKLLCAESRKLLDPSSCSTMEKLRGNLLNGEGVALVQHLQHVRWGAFLLGPIQLLTLAVFVFTAIETAGLLARWLGAPSYVAALVHKGLKDPLGPKDKAAFDKELQNASEQRVRAFVDRFLEKALSPSTTPAETRLRNYRDMLVDDCATHVDMLEMLGDTMLKIAFLGTVFGIGNSLFEARNLDAADPLIRLEAKSAMYAGIGMGFGATLVGIFFSIIAAKLRTGLSAAWLAGIDRAWREATTFYESNYRSVAANDQPAIPGVDPIPHSYPPEKPKAKLVDRILTFFGVICIVVIISALVVFFAFGAKSWSAF
ncbi:hypothetical protein ACLBXO_01870 [Methylobacterium sp. C33D]